jgi:hypothetical protein
MRLPMHLKTILIGIAIVAVSFVVGLKAMDWLWPRATNGAPVLAQLPPLPPASRNSSIMVPVAIALTAIRDAADRGAPRDFSGKADNPVSQILQNADIGWTASRGPITATGAQDVLSRRCPRRQCRETNWQREYQVAQCQRGDQWQRHHHRAAEDRRVLAYRA